MKKFISVFFIIIFGLSLIGGAIWYLFFYEVNDSEILEDEENTSFIDNFFPVETFNQSNYQNENVFFDESEPNVPILRQISQSPVAGYTIYSEIVKKIIKETNEDGNEVEREVEEEITKFRYVDKSNGHIYETTATTPQKERLSNTTIPKISEAIFLENPNQFILRFIDDGDDIKTYSAKLIESSTTTASSSDQSAETSTPFSVIGDFMTLNINNIFVNGFNYAYSLWNGSGYSIINRTPTKQSTVYESPINIWNPQSISDSLVALNSKPSFRLPGSLYFLNTKTNNLQKIISDKTGLTSNVSPDGKFIIYSQSINNSFLTFSYDTEDDTDFSLDFSALPEKCVWSKKLEGFAFCAASNSVPRGNYPDDWYKGLNSFNDNIIKFDAISGQYTEILKASQQGLNLDIIDIKLSPDEKYIGFINKNDLTLWVYKIKED